MRRLKFLFDQLYYSNLVGRLCHTLVFCLKKELKDCQSVLDLGCGPDSPLKCYKVPYSVGVEAFKPYLDESRSKKIHSKYFLADITKIKFKPKSFDAVILIDTLEHLKKRQGREILKKAERWAKEKVIISTPNGFLLQRKVDDNPYQAHQSGWTVGEMKNLGYKVYGMAGWRFLRKKGALADLEEGGNVLTSIRFRPRLFWLVVSALSQALLYYWPSPAYEIFGVKKIKSSR